MPWPSQLDQACLVWSPALPASRQADEAEEQMGLSVPCCLGEEGPARAAERVPRPPKVVLVGWARVVGAARAWLCLPP